MTKSVSSAVAAGFLGLTLATSCSQHASAARTLPAVYPVPQSLKIQKAKVEIPSAVTIVSTKTTDQGALTSVKATLRAAGVTKFPTDGGKLTVYVGSNAAAAAALGVRGSRGLPSGGYVLAAGQTKDGNSVIVLSGVDKVGQFYAAQTLRQLVRTRDPIPSFTIRDWPAFPTRGVVEGFYGQPWPLEAKLSMLDFEAAHKLNLYIYGPKDDPYLRARWRDPFPAAELGALKQLVARARDDHVTFNLTISPGLSICYSSAKDRASVIAKLASGYRLGVRSFSIGLDDVDLNRRRCASDAAYGAGTAAVATAQAEFTNFVERTFIATHPGVSPLILVPTEYKGVDTSPYKAALAKALLSRIAVQWTGHYGISVVITSDDAKAARAYYRHPVVLWDNYFTTDYGPQVIALGPLTRHDATLPKQLAGVTANPMTQAELSKLGLFTFADYAWNTTGYKPTASWNAATSWLAGGDANALAALRTFADANYGSSLNPMQAPSLAAAIATFWKQWKAMNASAAPTLKTALTNLRDAPATLRRRLKNPAFLAEASPWLDATTAWSTADLTAIDLLVATRAADGNRASADRLALTGQVNAARAITTGSTGVQVAPGVLDAFVSAAIAATTP